MRDGILYRSASEMRDLPYRSSTHLCPSVIKDDKKHVHALPDTIPIWFFWNDFDLKDLQMFVNNWMEMLGPRFRPEKVNVKRFHELCPEAIADLTSPFFRNLPQQMGKGLALFSDFVRLELLKKYGGLYVDISTIFTRPLDWLLSAPNSSYQFTAVFNPRNSMHHFGCSLHNLCVETSFILTPKNHPVIEAWLEECNEIIRSGSINAYYAKRNGPYSVTNLDTHYHVVYFAFQNMLKVYPVTQWKAYKLFNDQNIRFMSFLHYNPLTILQLKRLDNTPPPILKLIKYQRDELMFYVRQSGVNHMSIAESIGFKKVIIPLNGVEEFSIDENTALVPYTDQIRRPDENTIYFIDATSSPFIKVVNFPNIIWWINDIEQLDIIKKVKVKYEEYGTQYRGFYTFLDPIKYFDTYVGLNPKPTNYRGIPLSFALQVQGTNLYLNVNADSTTRHSKVHIYDHTAESSRWLLEEESGRLVIKSTFNGYYVRVTKKGAFLDILENATKFVLEKVSCGLCFLLKEVNTSRLLHAEAELSGLVSLKDRGTEWMAVFG